MKKITGILFLVFLAGLAFSQEKVTFINTVDKGSYLTEGKTVAQNNDKTVILKHSPGYPVSGKAEDLFNGAFDVIKKILNTENKYFKDNKKYTHDFKDLGLSFADVREQYLVNNTSRVYLNNSYYYVLTDNLIAVYYEAPANYKEYYHSDFNFDGTISCVAKAEEAKEVCVNLGGINPKPNARIQSWIIYSLPKDFKKIHSK